MTDILQQKRQLRDQLKATRKDSDLFHNQHTSFLIENIYRFVCTSCAPKAVVSCFWPLVGEADLRPLMQRLYQDGYQIALPKTPLRGNPLTFYAWSPTALMQEGRYKTVYPDTEVVEPDLILVPLMAFDRDGNRLGYGGGYYDRTLQHFSSAKAAGVAFSYQEVTRVPTEKFDFSLPAIITELEIIYIKG